MQVTAPAPDQLRRLAELRLDRPLVISLYLDLDPSRFATPARPGHRGALPARRGRPQAARAGRALPRGPRRPPGRARASADLPGARPAHRGGPRRGRVLQRGGRPLRDGAAAAVGAQPGGGRALTARRSAGASGAAGTLVRRAGEPPRRPHLPGLARRAARDRADPRHGLRPARQGRLVAGQLPAGDREGEGRPPEAHGRRADAALQAPALPAPDHRRYPRGDGGLRVEAPRLPAGAPGGPDRGRGRAGERATRSWPPRSRCSRSSSASGRRRLWSASANGGRTGSSPCCGR